MSERDDRGSVARRRGPKSARWVRTLVLGAVAAAGPATAGGCVAYYGTPDYGLPPHDVAEATEDVAGDEGDAEDAVAAEDGATETPEATYDYGVPDGG